jgi:hypothetical protein
MDKVATLEKKLEDLSKVNENLGEKLETIEKNEKRERDSIN